MSALSVGNLLRNPWPLRRAALATIVAAAGFVVLGRLDVTAGPLFHPHGYCYLWRADLVAGNVVSDLLIGTSYLTITGTLWYLVNRAKGAIPFSWIIVAFGIFIVACGGTHFVEVLTLWRPWFWTSLGVKMLTAAASVTTAVALPPLVPKVLTLIEAIRHNDQLRLTVHQTEVELVRVNAINQGAAELRRLNQALELEVIQRTAALEEKEVLLREIHHRVKNNMQVVASLLNLQASSSDDVKLRNALMQSQSRVYAMSVVHEALYDSGNLAAVDFASLIDTLWTHLVQTFAATGRETRFHADVDVPPFSIDRALPCALITTEVLSNSLKHAFPEGSRGSVSVKLSPAPDRPGLLQLRIADDGPGLTEDVFARAAERGSIGHKIIGALKTQLHATIVWSGPGTIFTMTFPADRPQTAPSASISDQAETGAGSPGVLRH